MYYCVVLTLRLYCWNIDNYHWSCPYVRPSAIFRTAEAHGTNMFDRQVSKLFIHFPRSSMSRCVTSQVIWKPTRIFFVNQIGTSYAEQNKDEIDLKILIKVAIVPQKEWLWGVPYALIVHWYCKYFEMFTEKQKLY